MCQFDSWKCYFILHKFNLMDIISASKQQLEIELYIFNILINLHVFSFNKHGQEIKLGQYEKFVLRGTAAMSVVYILPQNSFNCKKSNSRLQQLTKLSCILSMF